MYSNKQTSKKLKMAMWCTRLQYQSRLQSSHHCILTTPYHLNLDIFCIQKTEHTYWCNDKHKNDDVNEQNNYHVFEGILS